MAGGAHTGVLTTDVSWILKSWLDIFLETALLS